MSQAKHTPGPWELHAKLMPTYTKCDDFYAHTVTIGCGELIIGEVMAIQFHDWIDARGYTGYPRVSDFEQNICNARLIAAAPELLEALENYLSQDEIAEGYGGGVGGSAREQARAAIAKATGGE